VLTANPVVDVSQKVELHQHFSLPPVNPAPSLPEQKPSPPSHNVTYIGRKVARLYIPEDALNEAWFEVPENQDTWSVKGFIANFSNNNIPGALVQDWRDVRAHIIYRGKHGEEMRSVEAASWVRSATGEVNISLGSVKSVVIAILSSEDGWVTFSHEDTRISTNHGMMHGQRVEVVPLPRDVAKAEVILFDSHGLSLRPVHFALDLHVGMFADVT
jgi:hypothetical protein